MHSENKTLVILSPGFAESESDSTCLPAQQSFILALKNNYPSLNIIILAFHYPHLNTPYNWNNTRIIPFNGRNQGKLKKLLLWIRVLKVLKEIEKQNRITGVFSFWCTECALVGKYFGKRKGIKHFAWILGQDARKENRYIRLIRPRSEELVAMSDFLAKEFYHNHSIKPMHIIPNGIDPSLYSPADVNRDIEVLGVGSLIPLKNFDIFIEIINNLTQAFPSVQALICGKGPEENNLRSMISRFQLHNNISLVGEKLHKEVLHLMQRTRVLLHPSSYEGFSGVCLEALYAGAHVISFCKAMDVKIDHWHTVTSKREMFQALLKILKDPNPDHSHVLPYTMDNSAKAVMRLFGF